MRRRSEDRRGKARGRRYAQLCSTAPTPHAYAHSRLPLPRLCPCPHLALTLYPRPPVTTNRKAVSYVRFCNAAELATASTDSTLRLWAVEGGARAAPGGHATQALRVYEGHSNEKNFVGLAGALRGLGGLVWLIPCAFSCRISGRRASG